MARISLRLFQMRPALEETKQIQTKLRMQPLMSPIASSPGKKAEAAQNTGTPPHQDEHSKR